MFFNEIHCTVLPSRSVKKKRREIMEVKIKRWEMGHYQKQEKLRRRSEKKLARRLVCGGRVKDRYIQVKLTSPPPTVLPGYPPFSLSLPLKRQNK